MALMAVAAGASGLGAAHAIGIVLDANDVLGVVRGCETRPTCAGVEFCILPEQGQSAQAAAIDAGPLLVKQTPAERRFGPVMQQDAALFVV